MHGMSNTRKEIAARLGFAAGNGAKTAFANNDPALANFLVKYKENENNNYHSENVVLLAEFVGSSSEIAHAKDILRKVRAAGHLPSDLNDEQYSLYKNLAAKLKSKYPGAKFSRPGAKVVMEKSIDELKKAMNKAVIRWSSISSSNHKAQIKARQPNATPSDIQQAAALKRQSESAWREFTEAQIAYKTAAGLPIQQTDYSRPGTKTRMTREQTEEQKAGLKIMSAADPAVGAKIAKLIKEGKPQDQAVAIALDMKRRGEL